MYFLIDFENVRNAGMRGSEYLLPSDCVIVFYSNAAPTMEARHLNNVKKSACAFEVCKLIKVRKNALDFYIATRLGEIFGSGYSGDAAIISQDEGFLSLKEYWGSCSDAPRRVQVAESIERGIVSANAPDRRTANIRGEMKGKDIGGFFAAYEESRKLKRLLAEAFAGTELFSRLDEMEDMLRNGGSAKIIYLDALHRFGRKDGLQVYRKLKELV